MQIQFRGCRYGALKKKVQILLHPRVEWEERVCVCGGGITHDVRSILLSSSSSLFESFRTDPHLSFLDLLEESAETLDCYRLHIVAVIIQLLEQGSTNTHLHCRINL